MSDEALLKMKQDDWLEACKEIDKLKSDLDLAIEALNNAEEKFYQAWIKNEGFDDEQSKHELFEIIYEGREETKDALAKLHERK